MNLSQTHQFRKAKSILIAVLAIVFLIIALQNTANVETRLLFATVTMPRAVLLFVMLAIGFVIGWLSGTRFSLKKTSDRMTGVEEFRSLVMIVVKISLED